MAAKKGSSRAKKAKGGKPKSSGNGSGAGGGKAQRRQKDDDAAPGMGHNLSQIGPQVQDFAKRYNALLDEKEKLAGEIMADVKELLEEAANTLGAPRKIVRMAMQDQRKELKRKEAEAELEPTEREALETMRDALGILADLPLGAAAMKAAGHEGDEPFEEDEKPSA